MKKLTHAEISTKRVPPHEMATISRPPVAALLDNVRSLYNVGSIFRTSDGARLERLFLTGYTPHPPRREIEKTALGATGTVPWEYHRDPLAALEANKAAGRQICALELTDSSIPYYDLRPTSFPLCLVVGNEITGVSREVLSRCDLAIEIPMFGTKQSLNVAVAYGIVLFDLTRKLGEQPAAKKSG